MVGFGFWGHYVGAEPVWVPIVYITKNFFIMKIDRNAGGTGSISLIPETPADVALIASLFTPDVAEADRAHMLGQALINSAGLDKVPELPFDDGQRTLDLYGQKGSDPAKGSRQSTGDGCGECTHCTG